MNKRVSERHFGRSWLTVIGSGSVAAANLTGLCHLLRHSSQLATVVVLTEQALRFITVDALQHMGDADLVVNDYYPSVSDLPNHVWVNRATVATVVYPACADFIGKAAHGLGPDFASTVMLGAMNRPVLLVPSMNPEMWRNPLVQKNLETLRSVGVQIAPTEDGTAPPVAEIVQMIMGLIKSEESEKPREIDHA